MGELFYGIQAGSLPLGKCCLIGIIFDLVILMGWDCHLFEKYQLTWLYPADFFLHTLYVFFFSTLGFWLWGFGQVGSKKRWLRKLDTAFMFSGLKNGFGFTPKFIFDRPIDETIRRLRVSNAGLPIEKFTSAKEVLGTNLKVYIDEIGHNRALGTVDIVYSHSSMEDMVILNDVRGFPKCTVMVGNTRSKTLYTDFRKVPHLLVAGQSGFGKSTFLSQMIATLYINDPSSFLLIDLKEGIELQGFSQFPGITFIDNMDDAITELNFVEDTMKKHYALLREAKCKDIDSYLAKWRKDKSLQFINRCYIVIDEAADMWLPSLATKSEGVRSARRILSAISRKGRAAGIHLIVATQKPDVKALDSQVKTNLAGLLAFPMPNIASSMTILSNKRAYDLPAIQGRAIWRCGLLEYEVQTPYMTDTRAVELIQKHLESHPSKAGDHS